VEYFDAKVAGLALRVTRRGVKSWTLVYRLDGRVRRWTIGRYPALSLADAREKAEAARREIAHGGDPAGEKRLRRQAPTVADLADNYLTLHAKVHKRTWGEDARILKADILPQWGHRPAASIDRREVFALLDRIVERGAPIQANRVLSVLRKMYNWAITRDLVEQTPCLLVKAPSRERTRDRVLTATEIVKVWQACERTRTQASAILRLQVLTAQRVGEVRLMRWEEIDGCWWTVPASVSKNKLAHRVPLSPQALAILQHLKPWSGRMSWVFPSPLDPRKPLRRVQAVFARVRVLSGVQFRLHDLRRTAASHMTSMGTSRLVVAKILNHVERGATAVYDRHSYDLEKQQALTRWGAKVEAMLAGELGTVIALRG
jgi:integrase